MKNTVLIMLMLISVGCGSTFTGPVTGNKYNIDVGITGDMQQYHDDRNEDIDDKCKESQNVEQDCFAQEIEENKSN